MSLAREKGLQLRTQFRTARLIFFDCDGVIFDSNSQKITALREVLRPYPKNTWQPMIHYWMQNGGISRYQKFRHYFEVIHPVTEFEEHHQNAVALFGELSEASYAECEALSPALVLLRAIERPLYVISGTDQQELQKVFKTKHLSSLVTDVLGSPKTKEEHLSELCAQHSIAPSETLFLGDGGGDFRACQSLGIPFLYLAEYSEWEGARQTLTAAPNVFYADTWQEILATLSPV